MPCTHETTVTFYIYYCKLFIRRNQCSGNDIVIRYPPSAIPFKAIEIHLLLVVRCPCGALIITRARHNCFNIVFLHVFHQMIKAPHQMAVEQMENISIR